MGPGDGGKGCLQRADGPKGGEIHQLAALGQRRGRGGQKASHAVDGKEMAGPGGGDAVTEPGQGPALPLTAQHHAPAVVAQGGVGRGGGAGDVGVVVAVGGDVLNHHGEGLFSRFFS